MEQPTATGTALGTEAVQRMLGGERTGTPPPPDLSERRAGLAAAVAAGYWRTEPQPAERPLGGVRCLHFAAPGKARGTVLHMHGGAFRIGAPEQMGPFAAALAAQCHVNVVCPAYRLAPEHPFPAGLRDGLAVMEELVRRAEVPLVLSGDSAGGGLAAGLAALAHTLGYKLAGLALLSSWLDLTVTSRSYRTNAASDPLFSAAAASEAAALYLQGHSPADALASPLLGPVEGFPPAYVNVGKGEVLVDDAISLVRKLREEQVPVIFHSVDDMEHVAVTRDRMLTGSDETFAELAGFLNDILGQPPAGERPLDNDPPVA